MSTSHPPNVREDMVTARVGEIADNRAPIEQVKGMLMLVYDVGDDVAFGLLKWLSQQHNVKLRPLAEQISAELRAAAQDGIPRRAVFDHVLTTAHQRLGGLSNWP
jgi:ANTAR domain